MSAAPRLLLGLLLGLLGCRGGKDPADSARWPDTAAGGHGPMAEGIFAPLGQPVPFATDAQRAIFDEGIALSGHRFTPAEGLGPAFNLVSCAGCHEKPAVGGSAGRYRNFFLTAEITEDGAYIPGESFGKAGGVMRLYTTGAGLPPRPPVPATTNLFAQRNPIPFFGVGLIAELDCQFTEQHSLISKFNRQFAEQSISEFWKQFIVLVKFYKFIIFVDTKHTMRT